MQMEMAGNPCSGDASHIEADIESVRVDRFAEPFHESAADLVHLRPLGGIQGWKRSDVAVRGNHEMAVVIGIQIQEREDAAPAVNDVVAPIISLEALGGAEDASPGSWLCEECGAPRCPQPGEVNGRGSDIAFSAP